MFYTLQKKTDTLPKQILLHLPQATCGRWTTRHKKPQPQNSPPRKTLHTAKSHQPLSNCLCTEQLLQKSSRWCYFSVAPAAAAIVVAATSPRGGQGTDTRLGTAHASRFEKLCAWPVVPLRPWSHRLVVVAVAPAGFQSRIFAASGFHDLVNRRALRRKLSSGLGSQRCLPGQAVRRYEAVLTL